MNTPAKKNKEEFTLKEKFLYAGGTVLLTVGTFFLGRKLIRTSIENVEERKSFSEDSPATYAKRIKMSFENDGWPGTNTTELRKILRDIPSKKSMNQIANSYQRLYHTPLYKDMSDELQSTEYNEMIAIIDTKPDRIEKKGQPVKLTARDYQAWAKRLKAAFDKSYGPFPGTDEEAIVAVFTEIPTQADFIQVGAYYKVQNGTSLIDDLKGEGNGGEYDEWMKIILEKPKK